MSSDAPISEDNPIRLASRASELALAQTHEVVEKLAPHACRVEPLSTRGDEVLDRSLANIGGKGLFVKTLEVAMAEGRADAAVHSAKDMEAEIAEGSVIAAVLEREDRRDALVGPHATIESLPDGAAVGTASARRTAMLLSLRPDLNIQLLRGNVTSRLRQLADGGFDAIVLAVAGLKRLKAEAEMHPIEESVMLPAAGQGAIAVQAMDHGGDPRRKTVLQALSQANHQPTNLELRAERALLATLGGDCRTPIGASAHLDGDLTMKAALYSPDGRVSVFADGRGQADDPEELGQRLGRDLLEQSGGKIPVGDGG